MDLQARLYQIVRIAGVEELPSWSWNYHQNHNRGQGDLEGLLLECGGLWHLLDSASAQRPVALLVYCKKGANRSAAMAAALLAYGLHCSTIPVADTVRKVAS